jgi:uncharacterized protein
MGDVSSEPTMEDILASIKKIIAEDATKSLSPPRAAPPAADRVTPQPDPIPVAATPAADDDDILELTESAPPMDESELVSSQAEAASRTALDSLSRLVVKPEVHGADTLEGLVREMLKPMLKDWLDANLPAIVERVVAQEVARISGRRG